MIDDVKAEQVDVHSSLQQIPESTQADEKIVLSLCSRGELSEVQGLIDKIQDKMADVVRKVNHVPLDPLSIRKIGKTSLKNIDVMLLCHSSEDGRLILTDVEGSLYDKLLRRAKYKLGQKRVAVIVYDVDEWGEHEDMLERATFPTLYRKTSLRLICGRLSSRADGEVDMHDGQLRELKDFLHEASETPISCCCRRCRSNCCC